MKKKLSILAFLFVFALPVLAQPPGFDDTVDDTTPPGAPITALLPLGMAVAAFLGFKNLKDS